MKNLTVLFISFLVAFLIGELVLRLVPVPDPYEVQKKPEVLNGFIRSQFPPNMKLTFSTEEGLPGFNGEVTSFTTNEVGFRGAPLKENEYRIFAVGGSTTECLYVDDDEHWPYLLQKKLGTSGTPVNVQNAGKSGDAIDDHIAMITHRIAHLEPNMIIVYLGINDVLRLVCNKNPLKFNEEGNKLPVFKHFLSEFQLFRRLHNVLSKNVNKSAIAVESDYAIKAAHVRTFPESDSIPSIDIEVFKRKLDLLINISKTTGAELVLIPQLTTWGTTKEELSKWQWLTEICGIRYKGEVLADVMARVNNAIINAAEKHEVPVINPAMSITTEYFYDDCHFNPSGSNEFARLLFDSINIKVTSTVIDSEAYSNKIDR